MPPLPRLLVALLLAASAWSLLSSPPLGWGAADAPDGTRYKVSPLGVSHVLKPHQTTSPTEDCAWGASPPAAACALRPGATLPVLGLRLVPALLRLAAVLAFLGAAAWLAPNARVGRARAAAVLLPPALSLLALGLFAWAVPRASVTLGALPFGVGGTKATLELAVLTAAWLGFAGIALPAPPGRSRGALAGLSGLPGLLTFLLMFPPVGGAAFALVSFAAGAGLALAARRGENAAGIATA